MYHILPSGRYWVGVRNTAAFVHCLSWYFYAEILHNATGSSALTDLGQIATRLASDLSSVYSLPYLSVRQCFDRLSIQLGLEFMTFLLEGNSIRLVLSRQLHDSLSEMLDMDRLGLTEEL